MNQIFFTATTFGIARYLIMSAPRQQRNRSQWTRLTSWPIKSKWSRVNKVWSLEHGCFMIYCSSRSFYKYDMYSDKWTQLSSEFLGELQNKHRTIEQIQFDWVNERIFILTHRRGSNRTHIVSIDDGSAKHFEGVPIGELVNVNGTMHCVCDKSHSIWNDTKQHWQPINAFPRNPRSINSIWKQHLTFPSTSHGRAYHSQVIHVPSKHMLLMFLWSLNYNNISGERGGAMMTVWRHRIGSHEWTDVLQQRQFQGITGTVVLSTDQQCVIIAQPHLSILDIRDDDHYEIRNSTVPVSLKHSPGIFAHSDCAFGSANLVSGFTRRLDVYIPLVIVNMIYGYCSIERIHWITRCGRRNHRMIPLNTITGNER